jgi:hypothetical protein
MTVYQFATILELEAFIVAKSIALAKIASIYFDGPSGKHILVASVAPAGLSYTSPNIFTQNVAISALYPSSTGGASYSYADTDALPAGLAIDPDTGIITGTPTAVSGATNYTITATNPEGSTTFELSIRVNAP